MWCARSRRRNCRGPMTGSPRPPDAQSALLGARQPHLRRRRPRRADRRHAGQFRLHHRLTCGREGLGDPNDDTQHTSRPRSDACRCSAPSPRRDRARRLQPDTTTPSPARCPDDYRLRHPIAVTEGEQSIVVVRRPRPRQPHRDAARRRDGTGAHLAPRGHRRDRGRRAGRHAESRASAQAVYQRDPRRCSASTGVPAHAITRRAYHPDDPRALATIRLSYPKMAAVAGPCGLWPTDLGPSIDNPSYNQNKQYDNLRLRHPAQPGRDGRQSVRSRAAAHRDRRLHAAPYDGIRQIPQGRVDHDHLSGNRQSQAERRRANDRPTPSKTEPRAPPTTTSPRRRAISVQAFCATRRDRTTTCSAAAEDRRLAKAHLSVHMGGIAAAIDAYHTAPTPNVIVLETEPDNDFLAGLDELRRPSAIPAPASSCSAVPATSAPYRELVRRGVNDYVVGPVKVLDMVRSICSLFSASEAVVGRPHDRGRRRQGRRRRFDGRPQRRLGHRARSRAGFRRDRSRPRLWHRAASTTTRTPLQGIANAVFSPERPDTAFMERLLAKCSDHLSLLAAPATLDQVY